ncbi:hypothetical protein EDC22_104208 [Tepidamorphus gemmatus]|uniref:Uncharacterized protein n=1 Tax=Tepidamorphus gemmatus TaxID=747076 RepID=A0A4R3MDE6_9HYPH|nr:hypothetical protein EDC22_104208 [Tepidamorphus gemmatus]
MGRLFPAVVLAGMGVWLALGATGQAAPTFRFQLDSNAPAGVSGEPHTAPGRRNCYRSSTA